MEYKRLEIYVGWSCNQKCTYCMEFPNMEKNWTRKVTTRDILKQLIKYKALGYNHVTFLGGEPFIQGVFLEALILAKKLGYIVLVTTNASTLHIQKQAQKFLPYIDELILSVEGITKELQQKISRTKVMVQWEDVFGNINKYWKGSMLKVNIVITQDNLQELLDIVQYIIQKGVKEIAITYPDIHLEYYGKEHILKYVAPTYTECMKPILDIVEKCREKLVHLKLPDFPFCVFPEKNREDYIKMTDDFDYGRRLKVDFKGTERDMFDRSDKDNTPRERVHIETCKNCDYKNLCWGPSMSYNTLYGLDEMNAIKK